MHTYTHDVQRLCCQYKVFIILSKINRYFTSDIIFHVEYTDESVVMLALYSYELCYLYFYASTTAFVDSVTKKDEEKCETLVMFGACVKAPSPIIYEF